MNQATDRLGTTTPTTKQNAVSVISTIALILLIIGGLNWGSVGLFGYDLVAAIFGAMSGLSRTVYVLVGLAALYTIFILPRISRLG